MPADLASQRNDGPDVDPYSGDPYKHDPFIQAPDIQAPDIQATDIQAPDIQRPYAQPPQTQAERGAARRDARHVSPVRVIRRPLAAIAAVAGVLVITLGAAGLYWASHTGRPATAVGKLPVTPIPRGHWAAVPPARAQVVPRPTGLAIPAIGVRTKLIRLGLTASRALQVPTDVSVAGWYTGSPRPGGTGSAVIAGHIDSVSGPGVFFRLHELRPGELIYVQRRHGPMAVFRVTAVQMVLKSKFPTAAVYGPVPNAQLRLITCGGTFDPATGHYLSNVVVFATLE